MRTGPRLRVRAHRSYAVLLVAILAGSIGCLGQTGAVLHGDRITLIYPPFLSANIAAALLDGRERALAYVEATLEGTVDERITATIHATLLESNADSTIRFNLPIRVLEEIASRPTVSAKMLGCHEETHVVAYVTWGRACVAMTEGLAVVLDALYRGGATYHLVTLGLLACGELPRLDQLLRRVWAPRLSVLDIVVLYSGGASFVSFLLETYGIDALRTFYSASRLPAAFLEAHTAVLFGRSLAELEAEWHAAILSKGQGAVQTGKLFLDALVRQYEQSLLISQLEALWEQVPPAVGRSATCERIPDTLNRSLRGIREAADGTAAEWAYLEHYSLLVSSRRLLTTWLAAAASYTEALDTTDKHTRARLLRDAAAGYEAVGDTRMLDRVRDLQSCEADLD